MSDIENHALPGEMKHCPMCGNDTPKLYDFEGDDWGVECGRCRLQTVMVGTREQAVMDWNRRVPTTEDGKTEVARLRAALEEIHNLPGAGGRPNATAIAWAALHGVVRRETA